MKINVAKYTRRFVIKDYEFEEMGLEGLLEDGETAFEALTELKVEVEQAHAGVSIKIESVPEKKEKKENAKTNSSKDNDKGPKSSAKQNARVDGEGDQVDETSDAEVPDDSNDQPQGSEGDGDEGGQPKETESAEDSKGAKSAKGKEGKAAKGEGKKSFKRKPQGYDRSIEALKDQFSRILGVVSPGWNKIPDLQAKAKKASVALEGYPFLDENGEVLESFKAQVKKLMK